MIIKQTFSFVPTPKKVVILVLLLASILGNFYFFHQSLVDISDAKKEKLGAKDFPFISKRLFVEDQNDILVNFVNLRKQLNEYVASSPDDLGVYFEYLPSGVSIAVNATDSYLLASLLKVPMVMAIYHKIDMGELQRDTKVTIIEKDLDSKFGRLWEKGAGHQITIEEAVKLVLTESDNTAKNVLLRQIKMEDLANVFDYLDIPKESEEEGPVVSPKNYSSILRSLYLSSYLPKDKSNEILKIMTEAVHTDRLRAGVPEQVRMAHKIGVYEKVDAMADVYTDCGIVYVSHRPYILCVMTRSTLDQAKAHIATVSKIVYDYVSTVN